MTWHTNFLPLAPRKKRKKRQIYLYDKMMTEDWENFRDKVDSILQSTIQSPNITDNSILNKQWYKWSAAIKEATNKYIPAT